MYKEALQNANGISGAAKDSMNKRMCFIWQKNEITIRSSAAEYLTYVASIGGNSKTVSRSAMRMKIYADSELEEAQLFGNSE